MKKIPIRQINTQLKAQASSGRFTLRKVEDLLDGKDLVHELHRHDFFFILVLQKGNGKHEIDFINYTVNDNTIFILRPGQVHRLELKAGSCGFLIEFNNEFYQPPRKSGNKNFCQPDTTHFNKLLPVLQYMFQEYHEKQDGYLEIIRANLGIFFIELARQSRNPENTSTKLSPYAQERLEEFLELLERHSTGHKEVAHYTELMNLSSYQLNEITKATLGKTASGIINDHVILEAKRYLLATASQVKEIADQLGYEDISYFTRFFKKHTGYAPDAFRNNSR